MAETINPVVNRRGQWLRSMFGFFIGVLLGGAITFVVLLAIRDVLAIALPDAVLAAAVAAVVGLAVARDLGVKAPVPYRRKQVPEWLRSTLPPTGTAIAFGTHLGIGFLTLFTFSVHLAAFATLPFVEVSSATLLALVAFAGGKSVVLLTPIGATSFEEIEWRLRSRRMAIRVLHLATAAFSVLTLVMFLRVEEVL